MFDQILLMDTIPETNIEPENGWLEDYNLLSGWLSGRCELLVFRRVISCRKNM